MRVWNSVSLATLAVIGAGHMERAVACVAFSRADGGSLLACVDDGPDHTISVWEWQRDKHCLAETKVRMFATNDHRELVLIQSKILNSKGLHRLVSKKLTAKFIIIFLFFHYVGSEQHVFFFHSTLFQLKIMYYLWW